MLLFKMFIIFSCIHHSFLRVFWVASFVFAPQTWVQSEWP